MVIKPEPQANPVDTRFFVHNSSKKNGMNNFVFGLVVFWRSGY